MPTTRLAPSPTGALHLGNVRTFLINWALARQNGWHSVLRIEDLDGPRIKAEAADQAIDILQWLGINWDEGPIYQLADLSRYEAALEQLASVGEIYPCRCTRKELEAASLSAPHGSNHESCYPGTCRPQTPEPIDFRLQEGVAWRLRTSDGLVTYQDQFLGPQQENVHQAVGDFVVATKAGLPSYQLAVVVDDAAQQVDAVVRGDDLVSSTFRQQLLYDQLELSPRPQYWHLPLVVGEDGRRLAKRHGDTRVSYYRERGVTAEQLLGLIAHWSGWPNRQPITAKEFAEMFDLAKVPKQPVVFSKEDDASLLNQ